ncbi:MAG: YhjD/YihY/BrkB family envelope integrity protein [Candidatus Zophobacter franzmannii]|jgi:membrane protein|nr:YhjD/YihY/BrkB family envelope integrity protein [Candidatus Zophobacter franzmannii]
MSNPGSNFFTDCKNFVKDKSYRVRCRQATFGFLKLFWERIVEDKVLTEASALSYITFLGFVPFILFIVLMLPDLPFFNFNEVLDSFLKNFFLPQSAETIAVYVKQLLAKTTSFSLFNFILFIITSYSMFNGINTVFDRILRIKEVKSSSFIFNLLKFFGTIFFGFLVILILFAAISAPFWNNFTDNFMIRQITTYIYPLLIEFLLVVFLYFFVPTGDIRLKSIVKSAIVTAFVWFLVKFGFDWYIRNLTNIELSYGVLASVPIFLLWVYINWFIILSGIVLVSIMEHMPSTKVCDDFEMASIEIKVPVKKNTFSTLNKHYKKQEMIKLIKELIKEDENDKKSTD